MQDPPDKSPTEYALFKFAKNMAQYYHQACGEGKLDEYFKLVDQLYEDRWSQATTADALSQVFFFD